MLTGLQIKTARELLRWSQSDLADKTRLPRRAILRAERTDCEALITIVQENEVRRVLMAAGIEFIDESGAGPGVRLRKA
jgi:ribosome-binding protein aMBF1 (putative translation factor)